MGKTTSILTDVLRAAVSSAAERMGGCDPLWLKEGKDVPDFTANEVGAVGPEILLLHGLMGAVSNWDDLLPCLAKFSKAIALHFPILTAHRSEVKVKALAAYAECFIRSRNIAPVTLCGNSLGGHVALRLYLASPDAVDCLILSGASGLYEHSVDSLPVRPDKNYVREHMGRVFKQQKFVTEERIDEVHKILSNRKNVVNLIHAARSAKRDNLLEYLKLIKVPTLLLWGEDDVITTMQVAETFQKNIPNATLVTKSQCGHAPMIEYPEWFSGEVEKFMKQHSRYYREK